jgi:hypothetical protein
MGPSRDHCDECRRVSGKLTRPCDVNSCGEYPEEIWQDVWKRNGQQVMRHDDNMLVLLPTYMKMLQGTAAGTLFAPGFFEIRESQGIGA